MTAKQPTLQPEGAYRPQAPKAPPTKDFLHDRAEFSVKALHDFMINCNSFGRSEAADILIGSIHRYLDSKGINR